ncbi:hypothetical protein [Clostridium thermopalmarium]|nr:hypothetical protein [Clostridium thermopalmarium]
MGFAFRQASNCLFNAFYNANSIGDVQISNQFTGNFIGTRGK